MDTPNLEMILAANIDAISNYDESNGSSSVLVRVSGNPVLKLTALAAEELSESLFFAAKDVRD